ncbi:MAG: hypothetical protein ACE5ET_07785 [Gammaproteobacteria bacterium]
MPSTGDVMRCRDVPAAELATLLGRFGLDVIPVPDGAEIPGSFWGAPEAGLVGKGLYVRPDTPVHSALHEACHYICMDQSRREPLHTDAGGDYAEENAVCYLQILLADRIPGMDQARMCRDMDRWGYTFRLGSAQHWFLDDTGEVRDWLRAQGLLTPLGEVSFKLRL